MATGYVQVVEFMVEKEPINIKTELSQGELSSYHPAEKLPMLHGSGHDNLA